MNGSEILRFLHTVRHLRPVQIYGRFRRWAPKRVPAAAPPPAVRSCTGEWTSPSEREPSLEGPRVFRLLNRRVEPAPNDGWNDSRQERLWLYNLHYFDDLNARDSRLRAGWHERLIGDWIGKNPPGVGVGWEPYPLSLRIVNWIKWALRGNRLDDRVVGSLADQTRFLAGNLEWHHLGGNHLIANAKALIFSGTWFEGPEAEEWRRRGLKLFCDQVETQVLGDGGHGERSPMYHSIVLEDVLDVVNLLRAYRLPDDEPVAARLESKAGRMLRWLLLMCHPDGEISFFNDAAFKTAPSPPALIDYTARLGLPPNGKIEDGILHLDASGYVRLQKGEAVVLLDVGELGPDHLPGHAHADTLSFEMSLGTRRVFVNSGTSTYSDSDLRARQRSTSAHNTVEVDGRDSSQMWSSFRVGKRARPFDLGIREDARGTWNVTCGHDGYRSFFGGVVHTRSWKLAGSRLEISDRLDGTLEKATAYFHLHPGVKAVREASKGDGTVELRAGDRRIQVSFLGGRPAIEPASFFPAFGEEENSRCLVVRFDAQVLTTIVSWR